MASKIERLRQTCPVARECYDLLDALGRPTLGETIHYLELLGQPLGWVYWNKRWLPIPKLRESLRITRSSTLVPIMFSGGPPLGQGRLRKFKGSLYTLLLDRVMTSVLTCGLEATESKLGFPRQVLDQFSLTPPAERESRSTLCNFTTRNYKR